MIRISSDFVRKNLPIRNDRFHKGNLGKVLIVGGSSRYPTSSVISSKASIRAGAGLVTLATSKSVRNYVIPHLLEVMIISYEDDEIFSNLCETSDSIAIGMGLDRNSVGEKILEKVLRYNKKIIIDADGIFHLKKFLDVINGKDIIITPHEGEFSRLISKNVEEIHKNREKYAIEFAKKYSIKVLLKGKNTIITDGKDTYYIDKGSYKMATGGMGDSLSGIIASFSASGMDLFTAGISAVYVHSFIADMLSEKMYTVLASDVIENLPFVINDIFNSRL